MTSGTTRLGLAAAALIALWVLVYWWTPGVDHGVDLAFAPPGEGPEIVAEPLAGEAQPSGATASRTPRDPKLGDGGPAQTSPNVAPRADPEPRVIPPSFYRYTVRGGDTAQRISRRFFGTSDHWQQVMKANPKTDFQRLRAGMTILVPVNPANVQGLSTAKKPAPGEAHAGAAPTQSDEAARASTTPAGFTYKVEAGDTLSGLAQRFYGRASAWPAIVASNKELLGDQGQLLRPGITITIPPAPEPARGSNR